MADALMIPPKMGPTYGIAEGSYTVKITGEHTGGAYSLFEVVVPPGSGAPPHLHGKEDEAFYVLEGELTFEVGGRVFASPAGTFIQTYRNVPQTFHNSGEKPAKVLVWTTPSGLEDFFAEIGQILVAPEETPPALTADEIQRISSAAPKYGLQMLASGQE